jgi:hypothetical protein
MPTTASSRPLQLFATLSLIATLSGCAGFHERRMIDRGLLGVDLQQKAFLSEWGAPTTTAALSGDEIVSSKAAGEGRLYFKGNRVYEIWEYSDRQIKLFFLDRKLVSWETKQTVQELSEP